MTPSRTLIAAALLGLALAGAGCSDSPDALLTKAKESLAKKEPKAAEIHLKNLLQKEDRAEARFLLGQVHAANRDFKSAEKEFQKAVEGGYDKTKAGLGLADAYFRSGEIKKALDEALKLAPVQPADKADAQTLIGRAQFASGKRDEAEKAFAAAVAAVPDHIPAQLGLITLVAAKDIKAASAQIDALLAKAPQSTEVMSLKGDLELAQGRNKEAIEFFTKVATTDPKDANVRAKLASLASDSKDYAGAQKWLDELKKLTGPAPGTMHIQALNDFRQGKNEAARDAIQAGLKSGPNYLPSLALASTIYLSLNSLEQAELNARSVVEKAPNSTLGYRLLGATYLRMNSPERALQAVQPALDRGAKDSMLFGIAGEAALKLNEADKAATYFIKASELAPKDPTQKTGLGIARIAAGDKDTGIADLEAAVELSPTTIQADLALITQHIRDKHWDKALAAIDRLDKKQPNNPLTANLRGTVSLGKGDVAGARKQFEAALVQDPKFFAAVSNLAALDLRDKKVDDAKKRYTTLIEKDPKNVRAMLTLAQIIQGTGGDKKDVLEWIKKAREADKSSIPAVLAFAQYHLANNEPKEAIPALQEALTAAPDQIALLDALGTAYLKAGDESQAISTFEKILRAKPDSAPLQLRMGEFYMGRKDFDRALTHFRKSAELSPKAIEPKAAIASALVASGKIADARVIAANLQKEAPKSAAGAVLDGDILTFDKKYAEAATAYRKALSIQKALPISLKLHRSLMLGGKEAEADALLKSLLAESPKDPNIKSYAAMLDIGRKRWAQAIPLYKEVVALQPNNALALNNLAWALYETKDPEAMAIAEKAYAVAPKSPEVLDTFGTILLAKGDAARATDILKLAVNGAPKVLGYRIRLAEALIARGDKTNAKKELEFVLGEAKSGPVMEQAQALMKKL